MIAFSDIVSLQMSVLLMILTGFVLKKIHIIRPEMKSACLIWSCWYLCRHLLFILFPQTLTIDVLKNGIVILVIGFAVQFLAMGLNKFLYNWCPDSEKRIYQYGTLVSNGGLVGIPIISGLFGMQGRYVCKYLSHCPEDIYLVCRISLFTKQKKSWKTLVIQTITNPTVIAIFIGLLPSIFGLSYPNVILNAVDHIGSCLSAMSLIVVGSILADIQWKGLITKGMVELSANRLLIIPLIVLLIGRLLQLPEDIVWISVLLVGMPVASTCAVLARKYNQDYKLASRSILVTTIFLWSHCRCLLYFNTIPLCKGREMEDAPDLTALFF